MTIHIILHSTTWVYFDDSGEPKHYVSCRANMASYWQERKKYNLAEEWKASLLHGIINNWDWVNCQKVLLDKFWLMFSTSVIKKICFLYVLSQNTDRNVNLLFKAGVCRKPMWYCTCRCALVYHMCFTLKPFICSSWKTISKGIM